MMRFSEIRSHLNKNKYRWLITGIAGFIGSNILDELLDLNQEVVGIDNFSNGKKSNITDIQKKYSKTKSANNFKFIEGDICDLNICNDGLKNIDFVLHHAARGSVTKSIEDPIKTNNSNITGFLNLLMSGQRSGIKKFIYASSSSVYGDDMTLPKKEDKIGKQLSPYAITKYANELYARNISELYGLKTIGLRYFNVFGRRQDPFGDYAAVIPKWIEKLNNQEEIEIFGDGETSRDFCYIDNVIQINLLAALNDINNNSEIYNVACNSKMSLNQLAENIMGILKEYGNLSYNFKKIIHKEFRKGDIRHSLADISKAKNDLAYDPSFSAYEGLKIYIKWYLQTQK